MEIFHDVSSLEKFGHKVKLASQPGVLPHKLAPPTRSSHDREVNERITALRPSSAQWSFMVLQQKKKTFGDSFYDEGLIQEPVGGATGEGPHNQEVNVWTFKNGLAALMLMRNLESHRVSSELVVVY